ncbi:vacuolar protein sorting-associated protein 8 homolog [Anneissia japonica]|uniref:vacuolar protein sorting-associated protein 8 homolog n=1 Tax=Anneissia japonica TaxID=1529436 RepID=UPI0014258C36|nr:vacuolar protein sorting-associated protein 8 homolog [Anneissia japonica]
MLVRILPSRGEVCTIAPLYVTTSVQHHPLKEMSILAMATLSKVFIVSMRPKLTVMFTKPLKGDLSTLPLLAWQFVVIQKSQSPSSIEPVLAFARDSTIYFYQLLYQTDGTVKFGLLQQMTAPYVLLNFKWLNPRTLVTVDTSEKLRVIDVRSDEELEVIDLVDVQLVYGSSHFKSLATGGNVSKALALAGERACYQSLDTFNGQLILLGTKSIHVMTIRQWQDRIDLLVRQNKFQEALALAMSFYEGKAKAVVGLVGKQKRKQILVDKIMDVLYNFVDISMTQNCPQSGGTFLLTEHFQAVVPVCVEHCLKLGKIDILFGPIYERFNQDITANGVFLECLEPYILNDRLTSITPAVMKDFVDHYQMKGMVQNVEACIVHMDVASLDIHQVVSLCWSHGLYDAIIYVYNKGMQDYTTPLEDLLKKLNIAVQAGKQLTDQQVRLGNKLLVYISCCLAGRAYPLGDIPHFLVNQVKDGVWKCLTQLHTEEQPPDEPVYPHLRTLLGFDTREFLNVLALAFEEPEFKVQDIPYGVQSRQKIVDILLQIMVESTGFDPTQVGFLFTFLARQMAKHENTIVVNRLLFEQVLEFLCSVETSVHHAERQQALLELLNAGGLQQVDNAKLLVLAEKAQFFQVCELLYQITSQYSKIFLCHLQDPSRKLEVFSFVHGILSSTRYTEDEQNSVKKEVIDHLQDLIMIDSKETACLVLSDFSDSVNKIINMIKSEPRTQYEFLKGLIEMRDHMTTAINQKDQAHIEPYIFEMYIELMCQFETNTVLNYLQVAEGYRLEETLKIVRYYKVSDATAFLLEKAGDIQGAFGILIEALQVKVRIYIDSVDTKDKAKISLCISNAQAVLMVIVQLCQRSSSKMDEPQRQAIWFPLLDLMMVSQRKLKGTESEPHFHDFKMLTTHVLNSMLGYIALPSILQKIMQDPTYSSGNFGEIKELILGMLDTYNYEETLLNTTNQLLAQDLYWSLTNLTSTANKGVISRSEHCPICTQQFASSSTDDVIIFSCVHSYHTSCLQSAGCSTLIDGKLHWSCLLCNTARRWKNPNRKEATRLSFSDDKDSVASRNQTRQTSNKLDTLDPEQKAALRLLKKEAEGPSRMAILCDVIRDSRSSSSDQSLIKSNSLLKKESFQLRLAAPPMQEN